MPKATPSTSVATPPQPRAERAPVPLPGRRWRWLALVVLLAWAGWGFAAEGWRVAREIRRPTPPGGVAAWHLGTPASLSLGYFLSDLQPDLPANAVVAFSHQGDVHDERFFLTLWAAYFLPAQRVLQAPGPAASPDLSRIPADYLVTYNYRIDRADLEPVVLHHSGALYRVRGGG